MSLLWLSPWVSAGRLKLIIDAEVEVDDWLTSQKDALIISYALVIY